MLILYFFLINGALLADSEREGGGGSPENITVQVIDSKTVQVYWSTNWKNVERYDVTYNPTEDRVVSQAAGDSHSIVLRELLPNTQYQVTVTAVVGGKNYRSRRLVFRTVSSPNETSNSEKSPFVPTKPTKMRKQHPSTPEIINPDPTAIGSKYTPPMSTTVRGVEIGLVLLALVVWIIAIALFFHRWGKIRMLLPYQPDYKTQQSLKVPGTGTTIVSGCSGNNGTQGNQEAPGCVQHLRWSSHNFEDSSTAKKYSSSWASRPRVSSAIFPGSPTHFYARTSAECESPQMVRHAQSHNEFPTEGIPLCQVKQPRSESPENIIMINVPVITSNINEKTQMKKNAGSKVSEQKKYENDDAITQFDEVEFFKKERNKKTLDILGNKNGSLRRYPHDVYSSAKNSGHLERKFWQEEEKAHETKSLFFIESSDVQFTNEKDCCHFRERINNSTTMESRNGDKPKRYSRSSLKKQKFRFYDDRDLESEVYSHEYGKELPRDSKVLKTAEMKRKAFLRKVSLQETYLNYNQDYWLDIKNSGRFHKSIDLGYFGNDDSMDARAEISRENKVSENIGEEFPSAGTSGSQSPATITRQSKVPSKIEALENLNRSDSDPIILINKSSSCKDCQLTSPIVRSNNSIELFTEIIEKCKMEDREQKKNSWFFLPSNENIPLFSERNGLIETDFDMLNDMKEEERLLIGRPSGETVQERLERGKSESEANSYVPIDFSGFYEIKLSNSNSDLHEESVKRSSVFNFQGGQAFFGENFNSMSDESDLFTNEPELTESKAQEKSVRIRSSSNSD